MKFSIKDSFGKCHQTCSFLQIWSHLLKKSLMENFIFLCSALTRNKLLYTRNINTELLNYNNEETAQDITK